MGKVVHHMTFKVDQYVNTSDGFIGYIFEDTGSAYRIAICERDEERDVSASELALWMPKAGRCVAEIDNEDSPVGIVVDAGEEISLVVWRGLQRQVSWVNSCLQPVWID
jgi:hypothetical protein